MRNRVYITSIKDKSDIGKEPLTNDAVRNWTFEHKNILTFVPSLNGLFLNGKKYHSINNVKNYDSKMSVMELMIIRDVDNDTYNTNYIALAQKTLKKDFDIDSLILSVESNVNINERAISVEMSVGESVQMFVNKNSGFVFVEENPDCVVVDRNFIMHAIGVTSNGQPAKILIKHSSDTERDAALYIINVYIRYAYNNNIEENLMTNNILNDRSVSGYLETGDYAQAMEIFSERMISVRAQETFDKEKFNEYNATEQHMSSVEAVQYEQYDPSSSSTP